jgi:hypothetical protein
MSEDYRTAIFDAAFPLALFGSERWFIEHGLGDRDT